MIAQVKRKFILGLEADVFKMFIILQGKLIKYREGNHHWKVRVLSVKSALGLVVHSLTLWMEYYSFSELPPALNSQVPIHAS